MADICDSVIKYALSQVGYLEKKSNKDLDDFTANAGMNNYTKYGRDYDKYMGTHLNGQAWCSMFACMCFVSSLNFDTAKKVLGGNLYAYTPSFAKVLNAKHRKPKKGDLVFFYHSSMGRIAHVGLVYKVDSNYFYTVEGNTSSSAGVVRNGGCVAKKKYPINYACAYFGTPHYELVGSSKKPNKTITAIKSKVTNSNAKNPYKKPTKTVAAKSSKNDVKWVQWELNQWKSSLAVDGILGKNTKTQIKAFQKAYELTADGIAGPNTIAALVKDK